jgi:hypothetical protein
MMGTAAAASARHMAGSRCCASAHAYIALPMSWEAKGGGEGRVGWGAGGAYPARSASH